MVPTCQIRICRYLECKFKLVVSSRAAVILLWLLVASEIVNSKLPRALVEMLTVQVSELDDFMK